MAEAAVILQIRTFISPFFFYKKVFFLANDRAPVFHWGWFKMQQPEYWQKLMRKNFISSVKIICLFALCEIQYWIQSFSFTDKVPNNQAVSFLQHVIVTFHPCWTFYSQAVGLLFIRKEDLSSSLIKVLFET